MKPLLAFLLILCCSAAEPRTFFEANGETFSTETGWQITTIYAPVPYDLVLKDKEDTSQLVGAHSVGRLVTPHVSIHFWLEHPQRGKMVFHFTSNLAGHWPDRVYHAGTNRLKGFQTQLLTWDTNGVLTAAVIDFAGGKVRFNSDVP